MRGARPLTARQAEILQLIRAHDAIFREGPAPSLLAKRFAISVQAVLHHAERLARKGLLESARSPLTLTALGRDPGAGA